ncbi:hypothetical protein H5410_022163 [Solanum commersonii]|uniref:Uncharacterized protein n=1 Tax=Solanum commersonii TaxID=4109 RepID=A0A9J5ZE05_SOLCO|nr:hypothetical protein H5410_022163 [Solanum commersonii]
MILHIIWTLLVGVVVVDLGMFGAFLVLMLLLPFITRSWNQSIMPLKKTLLPGRPSMVRRKKANEREKKKLKSLANMVLL